jgi:hypothetical protein
VRTQVFHETAWGIKKNRAKKGIWGQKGGMARAGTFYD